MKLLLAVAALVIGVACGGSGSSDTHRTNKLPPTHKDSQNYRGPYRTNPNRGGSGDGVFRKPYQPYKPYKTSPFKSSPYRSPSRRR